MPPRIYTSATSVDVIEGGDASFECETSGNPQPAVTWYVNGEAVTSSSSESRELRDGNRFLTMRSVGREEGGKVACKAQNVAGAAQASFNLRVLVPPLRLANSSQVVDVSSPDLFENLSSFSFCFRLLD